MIYIHFQGTSRDGSITDLFVAEDSFEGEACDYFKPGTKDVEEVARFEVVLVSGKYSLPDYLVAGPLL
jgi:hypothetical protein